MDNENPNEINKNTWYGIHKEQVKLIQFLLYHLRKYQKKDAAPKQKNTPIEIKPTDDFVVRFD